MGLDPLASSITVGAQLDSDAERSDAKLMKCARTSPVLCHFFSAPVQLRTTVIGAAIVSSAVTFIKNRPSGATAYCGFERNPMLTLAPAANRVGNNAIGA